MNKIPRRTRYWWHFKECMKSPAFWLGLVGGTPWLCFVQWYMTKKKGLVECPRCGNWCKPICMACRRRRWPQQG